MVVMEVTLAMECIPFLFKACFIFLKTQLLFLHIARWCYVKF